MGSALYSLDPKFLSQNIFIPQVQEDCEVSGICENSPDYPHEYVEALLAKVGLETSFFLELMPIGPLNVSIVSKLRFDSPPSNSFASIIYFFIIGHWRTMKLGSFHRLLS